MKNNNRLSTIERHLIGFSLVGIAACTIVLYQSRWIESLYLPQSKNLESIGFVDEHANDARRRSASSLLWQQIVDDDPVYPNDSIFTGADSEALIHLPALGNSKIWIGENSLVTLNWANDRPLLDLELGELYIQARKTDPIDFEYKGSRVYIAPYEDGEIQIKVSPKELKLDTSAATDTYVEVEGKAVRVKGNEVLTLNPENPKGKVTKPAVKLKGPSQTQTLWKKNTEDVILNWEKNETWSSGELQLSGDPEFSNILLSKPAQGEELALKTEDLPEGRVFWRLTNGDGEEASQVKSFKLAKIRPPKLIFPKNVKIKIARQKDYVRFRWEALEGVESYALQLFKNKDFSKPILNRRFESTTANRILLEAGDYQWRVKGDSGELGSLPWSDFVRFKVVDVNALLAKEGEKGPLLVKKSEPRKGLKIWDYKEALREAFPPFSANPHDILAQKNLKAPQFDQTYLDRRLEFPKASLRNPTSADALVLNPPRLNWRPVDEAEKYFIEIARDRKFENIVERAQTKDTEFIWENAKPGTYWGRASGVVGGLQGPASSPAKLRLEVPTPKWVTKPEDLKQEHLVESTRELLPASGPAVELTWEGVPLSEQYRVAIKSDTGETVSEEFTSKYTRYLNYQPKTDGSYSALVSALDKQGRDISSISEPLEFNYRRVLKITSPKLTSPQDNVILVDAAGQTPPQVIFSWDKSPEAEYYEIQFSTTRDFSEISFKKDIKGQVYVLKKVPQGEFFWRVRARGDKARSDWTPPRVFALKK